MEVKVEVEIFDDPKYCCGEYLCDFLDSDGVFNNGVENIFCWLFTKELIRDDSDYEKILKCSECLNIIKQTQTGV
jgi:hypothetical protein